MITRRKFLQLSTVAGAGLLLPVNFTPASASTEVAPRVAGQGIRSNSALGHPAAPAFYHSPGGTTIKKFSQPLRGVFPLDPNGIPVAIPDAAPAPVTGVTHYSLDIGQYTDQLHPSLGPTTLWGYKPANTLGGPVAQRHLGGIIIAQKDAPIQLTFTNKLPPSHILPVDISNAAGAIGTFPDAAGKYGGNGYNAACVHLHGGLTPWISDGGPMAWFSPAESGGQYGPSIANATANYYKLLNPNLLPGQAEYYYPNAQSARMMWYHDHAHDITRLNAYAGIATAYIIRDSFEAGLRSQGLPDFIENGGREIPIVVQDKIFVGSDIAAADPTWPTTCPSSPGSLWYPHTYEPDRWSLKPHPDGPPLSEPSCIPEMFGDTMLVNGTVYPEATVEARRYRIRLLNACQARFLNLQLYVDDGSADGITHKPDSFVPRNTKGPDFLVLGTEGGFLSKPVIVPSSHPFDAETLGGSLITAPAERWDLIVDFSGYANTKVILYNDAPAPFPMGDEVYDFFPGAPHNPTQPTPGYGPNTRQIMRFNVVPATGNPDPPMLINTNTDLTPGINPSLVGRWTTLPLPAPAGVDVRILTLNEDYDDYGRLIQRLGTNHLSDGTYGSNYMDASTENPTAGSTEVWQIANLTGDAHPIHFHLVNVQVLSRQAFDSSNFNGTPRYEGPARGPDDTELGWRETVKMYPDEVTTVIMKFDIPSIPGIRTPKSLNPSLGVAGYEYVWHCHILEHEEHDMMRPLVVTAAPEYFQYLPSFRYGQVNQER
jgi:spore coat protein A